MKKIKWILLIYFTCLLLLAACNQSDSQEQTSDEYEIENQAAGDREDSEERSAKNEEIIHQAEVFIDRLNAGDYVAATENFDVTMASRMTAADLEELWETLKEQMGEFIDHQYNTIQEADDFQVVLLTGIFNNADVTFQITFDQEQQIAGFYIV